MKHVTLITGGSRGIGAACVRIFAAQGRRVWFTYCQSEAAAQQLAARTGAVPIRSDVSDPACNAALAEQISAAGGLELLVNNAAVSETELFQCLSPERAARLYGVNYLGAADLTRRLLPLLLQRHGGCILNIASMWGQTGASCEADYSASKAALIGLTRALAKDGRPLRCPGQLHLPRSHRHRHERPFIPGGTASPGGGDSPGQARHSGGGGTGGGIPRLGASRLHHRAGAGGQRGLSDLIQKNQTNSGRCL